jgi:hypothetical protein
MKGGLCNDGSLSLKEYQELSKSSQKDSLMLQSEYLQPEIFKDF